MSLEDFLANLTVPEIQGEIRKLHASVEVSEAAWHQFMVLCNELDRRRTSSVVYARVN